MASDSFSKNVMITFMVALFLVSAASVSAQTGAVPPSTTPSSQPGAAFSPPAFTSVAGFSIILSVLALLNH
ncbi:hypothetical protein Pint_17948 [Pistacia integerrima]|uniref:Uncharacterized protein n=1 Tax=Pistacia integerrima TaxID=434235 RepID=A0ACC0YYJ3_9ROSI|nr:hypothetical protein Pint_17948 [Pistacia integerrima]